MLATSKANSYGSTNATANANATVNANATDTDTDTDTKERRFDEYTDDADYRYIESTTQEKRRKFINGILPVAIFIVLMGAISFSLFKHFDTFYPGHGHESGTGTGTTQSTVARTHQSLNAHANQKGLVYADCAFHSKCDIIGLTGQCCPTPDGTKLACCNS